MSIGTIRVYGISDMVEVVAGLVREGLMFTVRQDGETGWFISLDGGY